MVFVTQDFLHTEATVNFFFSGPFTWNFLVMVFVTQDFLHTEATVNFLLLTMLSHFLSLAHFLQFFFPGSTFPFSSVTLNFFLPPTLESVQGSGVGVADGASDGASVGAAPHSLQDLPHHDDTVKSLLLTMLLHLSSLAH